MQNQVKEQRRKKWSVKTKVRVAVFAVIALIIAFIIYYLEVVCPIVVGLSEEKIHSVATYVISDVVGEVLLDENVQYKDIVKVSYSSSNKIDLIEIDSIKVNILIREITKGVQVRFDQLGNEGIDIAIGTFTGIPFLYGLGPTVSVQLVPVGTINTNINSAFTSAGINQTIHRLNFVVTASVGMVLPAKTQNFTTSLEVLLCESILVGDIPNVYLQGGLI